MLNNGEFRQCLFSHGCIKMPIYREGHLLNLIPALWWKVMWQKKNKKKHPSPKHLFHQHPFPSCINYRKVNGRE